MGNTLGRKTVVACLLIITMLCSVVYGNAQSTATVGEKTKYVVFRDDDVAPKAKFAELQAVNKVHNDKNVPVTLGIVPYNHASASQKLVADKQFFNYMKALASNPLFEFAQHGYTHTDMSAASASEFFGRPYNEQYNAIKLGRDDIIQAFGKVPTTFIPPFDKGDNNTLKAAKTLGFTQYSTAFRDFNVYQGDQQGIKIEAVSLVLTDQSLQSLKSKTEQFLDDIHGSDTFVVLYHPGDFSGPNNTVSNERVKLLTDYIDYLTETGRVQFTTSDRSWTTEGNARSSSNAFNPKENPAASTNEGGSNLTGNALNIERTTALQYVTLGLIALVCLGGYEVIGRSRSKQRPPQ